MAAARRQRGGQPARLQRVGRPRLAEPGRQRQQHGAPQRPPHVVRDHAAQFRTRALIHDAVHAPVARRRRAPADARHALRQALRRHAPLLRLAIVDLANPHPRLMAACTSAHLAALECSDTDATLPTTSYYTLTVCCDGGSQGHEMGDLVTLLKECNLRSAGAGDDDDLVGAREGLQKHVHHALADHERAGGARQVAEGPGDGIAHHQQLEAVAEAQQPAASAHAGHFVRHEVQWRQVLPLLLREVERAALAPVALRHHKREVRLGRRGWRLGSYLVEPRSGDGSAPSPAHAASAEERREGQVCKYSFEGFLRTSPLLCALGLEWRPT